jgi:hypothetical protein
MIVEIEKPIQRGLQLHETPKVDAPKDEAPMLVQDRALQPFDEPVGPRVPGLVRVGRIPSRAKPSSNAPLNSLPRSVSTRRKVHRARAYTGNTTSLRNASTAAAVTSPATTRAQP